ncbi:hypothetical protein ACFU98_29115 [Streptomyces sp. NPDC057575]|uniref:hypothetical protein n=1 Tax=Streptomyces sp. NPDC057575 TaxID=3346170 RepID=UPI0036B28EE0
MFRQRPHTVAVCIPGTGHGVHLEQPDVLRQVLQVPGVPERSGVVIRRRWRRITSAWRA